MIHWQHNPLAHIFHKHKEKLLQHKDKFIWFHSFYALLFGVGVMWLGTRNFNYIRISLWQVTFIWLSSLAVPLVLAYPKLDLKWKERIRLTINYFNRNFYQQLLFFVLPIYYMSTTVGSKNMLFIVLIAISAVLSTMDIIYDRFISVKGVIMSLFFAFNLFAGVNVMLPIIWGVRTIHAVRISAIFAFLGFATFCFQLTHISKRKKWFVTGAAALMIFFISELGRPFIPPAPMRLSKTTFGTGIQKTSFQIQNPLLYLPQGSRQEQPVVGNPVGNRIYVLTEINANLELEEKVRHSWYLNGRETYSSRFYQINGHKGKGFRLWTYYNMKQIPPGSVLTIQVETEGGQLIGRAQLKSFE
ncbi:MAG: DUF2914 domain-containing protein [Acidobacteria bacterium]|jgi:hypothetical protein|nr:DUF2914 domain-containing protein [Acidobacteriota bacterium]